MNNFSRLQDAHSQRSASTYPSQEDFIEDSEPERQEARSRIRDLRRMQKEMRAKRQVELEVPVIELAETNTVIESDLGRVDPSNTSVINISDNTGQARLRDHSQFDRLSKSSGQAVRLGSKATRTEHREVEPSVIVISSSGSETYTIDSDAIPCIQDVQDPQMHILRDPIAQEPPSFGNTVIEISDVSMHIQPSTPVTQVTATNSASDRGSSGPASNHTLLSFAAYNPDEPDDSDVRFTLARYAHRPTNHTFAVPSRAPSILSNPLPASRNTPRPPIHRFADFPDSELANLVKCVSCDIRWTSRKTAAQKMVHVQSCAKKNSLTDETVRILIRQALSQNPSDNKGKGKAKAVSPEHELPKTFLGDIADVVGKKKGKRVEILATVKSVPETRENILDRARALLEHSLPDGPPTTQAFGTSRLGNTLRPHMVHDAGDDIPPPTQVFPPSKLCGPLGKQSSFATYADVDIDVLPRTQTLAPSRLSTSHPVDSVPTPLIPFSTRSATPVSDLQYDRGHTPVSVSSLIIDYPLPSDSVNTPTQTKRTTTILRAKKGLDLRGHEMDEICELDMEWESNLKGVGDSDPPYHPAQDYDDLSPWQNDDAILHFDPEREPVRKLTSSTHHTAQIEPLATDIYRTGKSPSSSSSDVVSLNKVVTKKFKRSKRQAPIVDAILEHNFDIPQLQLEQIMEDMIRKDESLHLRILRYEPIDFEVFVRMANTNRLPPRGIKVKLRSFLDKQAINFYGAEPGGTRKRRPL